MPTFRFHPARTIAAAVTAAALATTGAACSSSSNSASPAPSTTAPSTTAHSNGGATPTSSVPATATKASDDGPNPCTIVSAAEVQAILGTAATATGPTEANRGTNCAWHPGNGASVLVQVFHGKEFYDPSMQAPNAKKLTGVGDDAYLDAFGTTRASVGFLKGDTAVFIDGFQVTSADAVVAAAKHAASQV